MILDELVQVYSKLEIPTALCEFPTHFNAFDMLHIDFIESIAETNAVLHVHSKLFDSLLAIKPISINASIFFTQP